MIEDVVVFPFNNHGIPISVPLIGIAYCDENYKIYRKNTNLCCIEYVLDGIGYIIRNGIQYTVTSGDLYIIRPFEPHLYFADKIKPLTKICLCVYGDFIQNLIDNYNITDTVFKNTSTKHIFYELFNLAKNEKPEYKCFCSKVALGIHQIFEELAFSKYSQTNIPENIMEIKKIIDLNIEKKVSLNDIAQKTHISKPHMIKYFKKYYGFTPYDYLLSQRIDSAKIFLNNSSLTIKEISARLCFTDEHYFSNIFKEKTGQSPSEYKNKI